MPNPGYPGIIDQLNGPTPKDLSLEGQDGPYLEIDGDVNSDLHAYTNGGNLISSRDLWTGSYYRYNGFAKQSNPPYSFPNEFAGKPYYPSLGGAYKDKGPVKGRY